MPYRVKPWQNILLPLFYPIRRAVLGEDLVEKFSAANECTSGKGAGASAKFFAHVHG